MRLLTITLFFFLGLTQSACDPEHRKKCEWFLIPDTARKDDPKIDQGFIPVCARNLVVNKEDCRLQATPEFAKSAWNKKFRYTDLKTDGIKLPQRVSQIDYCE